MHRVPISDGELSDLEWHSIAQARSLELPNITRVVLEDLSERIAAGALQSNDVPVPFYHRRNGVFRRDLIGAALRRGRLRRHRAPVLALVDRAGLPVAGDQPADRRLRGFVGAPGPAAPRDRGRRPPRHRCRTRPRRAPLRRRAHRRWHHDRRGRGGGRDGRGHGPGRLHQHLDRRGDGIAVHDRGVDARPAGLRARSSPRPSARRWTSRSSVSAASRTRSRPSGPWPTATAISSGSCGARSPTPSSQRRPAPAPRRTSGSACPATRSASAAWASTAGSGASRTRGRGASPRSGVGRAPAAKDIMIVGAGPAGLQAAIAAARRGHRVTVYEKEAVAGGQVRLAASVPNRTEFGDIIRNQLAECRRLGVTIEYGTGVWPGLIDERRPDHVIVATGAEAARPWWAPAEQPTSSTCARCSTEPPTPSAEVVVVDEIGFHHATSVAELLADRGCQVEVVTNGMVVGQDLGITLDMENWWIRASAKGIAQSTDLVPMGFEGSTLQLLHHPTGEMQQRTPDWVVLAVPANPVEWLYQDLKVGACRWSGSGTAWPRGGPTQPSSRANGQGRTCDRSHPGAGGDAAGRRGDETVAECGGHVLLVGRRCGGCREGARGPRGCGDGLGSRGVRPCGMVRRAGAAARRRGGDRAPWIARWPRSRGRGSPTRSDVPCWRVRSRCTRRARPSPATGAWSSRRSA